MKLSKEQLQEVREELMQVVNMVNEALKDEDTRELAKDFMGAYAQIVQENAELVKPVLDAMANAGVFDTYIDRVATAVVDKIKEQSN